MASAEDQFLMQMIYPLWTCNCLARQLPKVRWSNTIDNQGLPMYSSVGDDA